MDAIEPVIPASPGWGRLDAVALGLGLVAGVALRNLPIWAAEALLGRDEPGCPEEAAIADCVVRKLPAAIFRPIAHVGIVVVVSVLFAVLGIACVAAAFKRIRADHIVRPGVDARRRLPIAVGGACLVPVIWMIASAVA